MSTEEDSELGITPSADDILEVSPVNSYNPSCVSPTASLRNRRSNNNEDAFSSSSDGYPEEDDGSETDTNGDDDEDVDDDDGSEEQQRQQQLPLQRDPHNNQHQSLGITAPASSSSPPSQSQKIKRNHYSPSEFDKALLTGVPSRGHATSFFSADSMDASDAHPHPSDAIVSMANGSQLSWDADNNTEVSLPTLARHVNDRQRSQSSDNHEIDHNNNTNNSNNNEWKPQRVNTAAATKQPSSESSVVSSISSNVQQQKSGVVGDNATPSSNTSAPTPAYAGPPTFNRSTTVSSSHSSSNAGTATPGGQPIPPPSTSTTTDNKEDYSSGVLPDVLMTMRQQIESMQFFDSDMIRLAAADSRDMDESERESLKRSSQQSISAAVLVSLAHKRYERRRLAAMEIEKVVRSLVLQNELERVRAILLLLSDDYVRSTNEDARKGGVVALAACAIGLKKAHDDDLTVRECRDLLLASVVHACQDHSQRVRYYATESLFNVVKVIPGLAVQHFFILFEILRSLYADVDVDVRSGAELLDKKLKEVIVGAMNSGSFTTDACVPVFARFVYMRNKATKRLTLTWLQELNEKLIGAPILEFLHLFLGGIFEMVGDPQLVIRQSALAFLQSVLPKLLVVNSEAIADMDDSGMRVDFDKILQSLVTTMEHPDPFVRKVAMYWMSRIVKAHMKELHDRGKSTVKQPSSSTPAMLNPDGRISPSQGNASASAVDDNENVDASNDEGGDAHAESANAASQPQFSAASMSVRNSLPHVLPGILLSIGDTFNAKGGSAKDSFLPDVTTKELAEQTNACLRDAVRRDGEAYVQHLDSFIVALREELDSPGGLSARNPPAEERRLYRIDVNRDGTGIERPGWFRKSSDTKERDEESVVSSRLCALHWVIVLYESVVPDALKAEYAREFIIPIIHQLVDNPPEKIVIKSLEVLAKITIPVSGEDKARGHETPRASGTSNLSGFSTPPPSWASPVGNSDQETTCDDVEFPVTDANICFALDILHPSRRKFKSRDREVFTALIQLHSYNQQLLADLSRVISFMCRLQPPEFVFVSFAVELDFFVRRLQKQKSEQETAMNYTGATESQKAFSSDLKFVSSFVQQMSHVLLNADEAEPLRDTLRDTLLDCVGSLHPNSNNTKDLRRIKLFHIILHSFSHSVVATVSLCLWGGAYRTASLFLSRIVPLDINLVFLLELDKLIEQLERPLFRHLHIRMLERNQDPCAEGSGTMLFKTLKFLLMITPQSTCYTVLKNRLVSLSRFRQSTSVAPFSEEQNNLNIVDKKTDHEQTDVFVARALQVRAMHCDAMWETIRSESLETEATVKPKFDKDEGESRREWLGYASKEEQRKAEERYRREKLSHQQPNGISIEEITSGYQDLAQEPTDSSIEQQLNEKFQREMDGENDEDPPSLRKTEQSAQADEMATPDEDDKETKDDDAWKSYWAED